MTIVSDVESQRLTMYATHPWKVYGVLVLLSFCYFGKYFCTSDMYIVQALFMEDAGITEAEMSTLFAFGYFASIFGKLSAGAMSDAIGGRFVILLSAFGYVASTAIFSLIPVGSSLSVAGFFALWLSIGYFALGLSWVAIVAVATNWIPASHLGRLMGFVSMAPQLGDALARLFLAHFLGDGWRAVFRLAAGIALGLTVPVLLFVPNAPLLESGKGRPIIQGQQDGPQVSYIQKLKPLLKSPNLWLLCLLSGSLYGTRTLFLLYSTTFLAASYCRDALVQTECMKTEDTMAATASASALYTLLGCVSVLLVGVLKDMLPKQHRAATLTLFVAPLFLVMAFLTHTGADLPFGIAVGAVGLVGFALFGPYKVLGAVFAVDVGGKELKSTCTAFMGVFDNVFAMIMLFGKGAIGNDWSLMFSCLTILSCVALLCATLTWLQDIRADSKPVDGNVPLLSTAA